MKLHSSFLDKKNVYMVFDYAVNSDFAVFLKLNKTLNQEQSRFYIAQMVNILCFLRSKGVMHRDLKPGNFLFNETWHLVLADFGTAKQIKTEGDISPSASTSNVGNSFSSAMTRESSANNLTRSTGPVL